MFFQNFEKSINKVERNSWHSSMSASYSSTTSNCQEIQVASSFHGMNFHSNSVVSASVDSKSPTAVLKQRPIVGQHQKSNINSSAGLINPHFPGKIVCVLLHSTYRSVCSKDVKNKHLLCCSSTELIVPLIRFCHAPTI